MSFESKTISQNKIKSKSPSKYKVIFLNDDKTPMNFVMDVLAIIFKHDDASAEKITYQIHEEGSGIAGIYAYEVAEHKAVETVTSARKSGFPLEVKLQEDL